MGDSLYIGPLAAVIRFGDKFSPFGTVWSGTANLEGAAEYDTSIVQDGAGAVLLELHAEAIALGCEIQGIQPRTGRHGDYHDIELVRRGFAG